LLSSISFFCQKYQTELSESEQRNIQIQQLGKSSLAIAQKGFEDKLKSLRKLASEQEAALSEDERTIDSLRLQIAQLQRSGQTVTVPDVNPDEAGTHIVIFHVLLFQHLTSIFCSRVDGDAPSN
jgi:hypothetical protein